jgi:hypothetical protein
VSGHRITPEQQAQQRARRIVDAWQREHDPRRELPLDAPASLIAMTRLAGRELDADEVHALLSRALRTRP